MRHSAEVEWVFVRRPRVAFSFGRADDRLVASGFHHAAVASLKVKKALFTLHSDDDGGVVNEKRTQKWRGYAAPPPPR